MAVWQFSDKLAEFWRMHFIASRASVIDDVSQNCAKSVAQFTATEPFSWLLQGSVGARLEKTDLTQFIIVDMFLD